MSKRPKILTLSDAERSALGDLKAAIDVANHIGLLDRLAEVVHPNIVNDFVDAVCQLLERGPKLGSFVWHYHELEQKEEAWHEFVLEEEAEEAMTNDELAEALERHASSEEWQGFPASDLREAARRLREVERIAASMLHDARCNFDVTECSCDLDSLRRVTGGRS